MLLDKKRRHKLGYVDIDKGSTEFVERKLPPHRNYYHVTRGRRTWSRDLNFPAKFSARIDVT